MTPTKMEPHRLEEIRGALRERPRTTVAQWGNATVYDLMAHIAALETNLDGVRQQRDNDARALEAAHARCAALESEVAQARDAALLEVYRPLNAAFHGMDIGTHGWSVVRDTLHLIRRALESKPAQEASRPLFQWSEQKAQRCYLGDEDRRPDDEERAQELACSARDDGMQPCETASEANGLLPKRRRTRMPPCGHARCEVLGSGEEAHVASCPNFGTR